MTLNDSILRLRGAFRLFFDRVRSEARRELFAPMVLILSGATLTTMSVTLMLMLQREDDTRSERIDPRPIVEPELPRLDCELGAAKIALHLVEHRDAMAKLDANGEPSARAALIRSGLRDYLFIADVVFAANDNARPSDVVEAARAECRRRSA